MEETRPPGAQPAQDSSASGDIERSRRPADDRAGKIVGLLVFALGIVLLALVFVWAYSLFAGVAHGIPAGESAQPQNPGILVRLGNAVLRLCFLFVMGYVASLVASKGLQFYGVCRGVKTGS